MAGLASKPTASLNFESDDVKIMREFALQVKKEYATEKNALLTICIIECLMYIKLNYNLIEYAIQNKDDSSLYTYTRDKKNQVLRAHNDMSFHIAHDDSQKALKEFTTLMVEIERGIQLIEKTPNAIKTFIRKMNDSEIGCMEHRLKDAREYVVDLQTIKLNDLFDDCWEQLRVKRIDENDIGNVLQHVINFFHARQQEEIAHDGKIVQINGETICSYLAEAMLYDKELDLNSLLAEVIFEQTKEHTITLHFANEKTAKHCWSLIKLNLPFDLYTEFHDYNSIVKIKDKSIYSFDTTAEQLHFIASTINKDSISSQFIPDIDTIFNELKCAIEKCDEKLCEKITLNQPAINKFAIWQGFSPLNLAVSYNKLSIVKVFTKNIHVDINSKITQSTSELCGYTPLLVAASCGHIEIISWLLKDKNIDKTAVTPVGKNVLHLMVEKNNLMGVKYLLSESNANIWLEATDKTGMTPLDLAASWAHDEMTDLLAAKKGIVLDTSARHPRDRFLMYAANLRKMPTPDFENHFKKMKVLKKSDFLPDEKEAILTRKLWSDVVSSIEASNQDKIRSQKVELEVINKINKIKKDLVKKIEKSGKSIKYDGDAKFIFKECIRLLQERSVIVLSFNASFLNSEELNHYDLLNIWERDHRGRPQYYREKREGVELELFKELTGECAQILTNKHARPRYAELQVLDANILPRARCNPYGRSFMVLKKAAGLFNSFFAARDTLDAWGGYGVAQSLCTYHSFELLLQQCSDGRLEELCEGVLTGTFPANFGATYFEALLSRLNFLSPDVVEMMYFNPKEYSLNDSDKAVFTAKGIYISNENNIYDKASRQLHLLANQASLASIDHLEHDYILQCASAEVYIREMIGKMPTLLSIPNQEGESLLQAATQSGNMQMKALLEQMGMRLNKALCETKNPTILPVSTVSKIESLPQKSSVTIKPPAVSVLMSSTKSAEPDIKKPMVSLRLPYYEIIGERLADIEKRKEKLPVELDKEEDIKKKTAALKAFWKRI